MARITDKAVASGYRSGDLVGDRTGGLLGWLIGFLAGFLFRSSIGLGKAVYSAAEPHLTPLFATEEDPAALPEHFEVVEGTSGSSTSRLDRLEEIQTYLEKGLISAELAESRRKEILDEV